MCGHTLVSACCKLAHGHLELVILQSVIWWITHYYVLTLDHIFTSAIEGLCKAQ